MATTNISQDVLAIDTALTVANIGTLTTGSYALGAAIDNRATTGTTVSADLGDLRIPLTSVTPAAGTSLTVFILPAVDGGTTNYASPNAATAAPPNLARGTYIASGTAVTELVITDIPLGPYSFKVSIQNNLGTSISATGNAQLQRKIVRQW